MYEWSFQRSEGSVNYGQLVVSLHVDARNQEGSSAKGTSALSLALGFETGSYCVDQTGLEFREMTLLLLPIPGQRHVGPHLVQRAFVRLSLCSAL